MPRYRDASGTPEAASSLAAGLVRLPTSHRHDIRSPPPKRAPARRLQGAWRSKMRRVPFSAQPVRATHSGPLAFIKQPAQAVVEALA